MNHDIDAIRTKNKIPVFIAAIFSALMLAFMAVPKSQYDLMGIMSWVTNGEATPDWGITIPGIMTMFAIIFLVIMFLIATLSYLSMRLYNYRILGISEGTLFLLEFGCEAVYLVYALQYTYEDGSKAAGVGNVLIVALNLLALIAYAVTYIFLLDKPYKAIMKEIDEYASKAEPEEKEVETVVEKTTPEEEAKAKKEAELKAQADAEKSQMRQMVLRMVSEGKMTPEEADRLLNELK